MDRRQLIGNPEEALRMAMEGFQSGLWSALPGIIKGVDLGAMTATVQPAIRAQVRTTNGELQSVELPLLVDVPIIYPCGGGFTLTFPISSGDECLVIFSSRAIDNWWQAGGVQDPVEYRMHDLSDGFALVGARSQVKVISGISNNSTQLRSDDGSTYVEVKGGQVNVVAPSQVTITTPTTLITGNVIINGTLNSGVEGGGTATFAGDVHAAGDVTAGPISVQGHTHSGVQPGGGNSGGPNP